jgi:hypothetical protein
MRVRGLRGSNERRGLSAPRHSWSDGRSSMMCYGWHYGPHAAGAHQRKFITLLGGSAAASAAQKSVHEA